MINRGWKKFQKNYSRKPGLNNVLLKNCRVVEKFSRLTVRKFRVIIRKNKEHQSSRRINHVEARMKNSKSRVGY